MATSEHFAPANIRTLNPSYTNSSIGVGWPFEAAVFMPAKVWVFGRPAEKSTAP